MAYTVHYHGHEVECDTAEEVRALLSPNGTNGAKSHSAPPPKSGSTQAVSGGGMAAFLAKLQKEQRDTIHHILQNGIISRDVLIKTLGITDTHHFSGIMIGIQKNAAKTAMTTPIETLWERQDGRGPRVYQYKIKDVVKAELKEGLAKFQ